MVNSETNNQKSRLVDFGSTRAHMPKGTKIQSNKNSEKLKISHKSDKTPLPHNSEHRVEAQPFAHNHNRPGLLRSPHQNSPQQFQNQSYASRFQQAKKVHPVSHSPQPSKTVPQPNAPHFRQQKLPNKSQPLQNVQTPNKTNTQQMKTQVSEQSRDEKKSRDASDSKSPMAAINDLARYNKLVALYELIATQGPPHSRKFAVRLTLNDQSWICEDTSIRKAQHACAAEAIEKCTLPKPLAKEFRKHQPKGGNVELNEKAMTDTVILNTLASKFGFKINYSLVSRKVLGEVANDLSKESKESNKKPERIVSWAEITEKTPIPETARKLQASTGQRPPMEYTVEVEILTPENLKFTGIGSNPQAAKHRAASLALAHFSTLFESKTGESHQTSPTLKQNEYAKNLPKSKMLPQIATQILPLTEISPQFSVPSAIITSAVPNFGITRDKSSITLVYEMAARRKMPVVYETVDNFSEKGKSRRKTYEVKLTVGPSTLDDPGDFRGRVFLGQAVTTSKQEAKRMASSDVMNKMMADLSPLDKELQVKEKKICTAPGAKNIEKDEKFEKTVEKGVGLKLEKSVELLEKTVEEMIQNDLTVPLTKMVLKEGEHFKRMKLDKKVIGKVKSQPSNGNLHRSVNLNVDSTSQNFGLHPVSRLSQLIQLKKLRDPVYEVIIEPINKRSGFRTICRVTDEHGNEHVGEDLGVNKKDSKKLATVQVLKSMGFEPLTNALKTKPSLQPIIRTNDSESRLENHPVTITQSSPLVLNKSSKKLAKKQVSYQMDKQFKIIDEGDGVLGKSSDNEELSEISKNKSVSKNSVSKTSVSKNSVSAASKSIESDTFIGKLENMKAEGKILKIAYKNSQRKSGGYLTILTVTLASGKPILLHNLGATIEEASEVAAKKTIAEILKKEAKGDQDDSDEDDSDEDSDDE